MTIWTFQIKLPVLLWAFLPPPRNYGYLWKIYRYDPVIFQGPEIFTFSGISVQFDNRWWQPSFTHFTTYTDSSCEPWLSLCGVTFHFWKEVPERYVFLSPTSPEQDSWIHARFLKCFRRVCSCWAWSSNGDLATIQNGRAQVSYSLCVCVSLCFSVSLCLKRMWQSKLASKVFSRDARIHEDICAALQCFWRCDILTS